MTDARSPSFPLPRRYLALWFPWLPTDRQSAPAARHEPLVMVDKIKGALRLVWTNKAAADLGLAPGLGLADARARFPDVAAVGVNEAADAALLAKLAGLAERFSPSVALDEPHGLLIDITGCAHLFGGEVGLRARLCWLYRQLGLGVRATVAGTPDAARAIARFGATKIVAPGTEEALVRPLPIAALGQPDTTVRALARAGLRTIGDLADRPSTALSSRFGEGLARALRRTLGYEDARLMTLRPVPDCVVEQALPEPLTHMEGVMAVLSDLAIEAARLLGEQGAGGRAFEATLFRSDGVVRRVTVQTGQPTRDPPVILKLFDERLDALADPIDPGFGFDLIRLAVPVAEPLAPAQPSLDGARADEIAIDELLDRLAARLGRDRVLVFARRNTHDPSREVAHMRVGGRVQAARRCWPLAPPGEPATRPLRLFARPQPIDTLAEVPDGPPRRFRWRGAMHEIVRAEGPERIAPEWWRGAMGQTRDYYRTEDRAGRRFWLFREGLYGEVSSPRWYLHGTFA